MPNFGGGQYCRINTEQVETAAWKQPRGNSRVETAAWKQPRGSSQAARPNAVEMLKWISDGWRFLPLLKQRRHSHYNSTTIEL